MAVAAEWNPVCRCQSWRERRIFDVLFHVSDLPRCYLTTKRPLQKFNHRTKAKRTDRRKRENGRVRQTKWYVPLVLRETDTCRFDQTLPSISSLILWWSITSSLSILSVSLSHAHTYTSHPHFLDGSLFLSFISFSYLTSPPNISCFSPSFLVPISVFLATFKFSLSLCFVGLHFLIIISVLVTKVQLYFQVVGLCSFGKLIKNCLGLKQSLFLFFWNRW